MTASAPPPWSAPPPPPRRSWGAGRVVSLVLGILLLLPALGLLGGGGTLLWADWTQRESGFVVSPHESFASQGYALASERIDLRTDADWLPISATLGTARVEVTGRGSQEVFVGIAPAADASAYLGSVQRTVIRDLGFDQPASQVDQRPGDAPSGPPGDQPFWSAQTSGPGTQALTWDPAAGDWMLVVMNADASAGVVVSAHRPSTADTPTARAVRTRAVRRRAVPPAPGRRGDPPRRTDRPAGGTRGPGSLEVDPSR
jgi:hypothetical protein